jgi:hypothetical protein
LDEAVHVRLIVEFIETDNVRMVHLTEDFYFVHDESLVFRGQLVLLEVLDSTLFLCGFVHAQTHFTEATLTQDLTNLVVFLETALSLCNESGGLHRL